ncbi:MAG: hypothetical protein LBE71_03130, partial [Dysgonamonadaceae bacterium]|nr:hypothetical protein [Dysgonamonadaceae bacterium]
MNKKIILHSFILVAMAGFMVACSSSLKPLASDYVKVDPQPLELFAGEVPVTINATFPANWFNKKATVVITPVLRYEGGEVRGTSYSYQGEKVAGNGQVIPQKAGASITLKSSFNYVPAMQKSELYLTFSAKVGKKEINLPEIKIGEGVLATAALLDAGSEIPAIIPDKFQKIIKEVHTADIMFLIQQAELRSSELKKAELADWKNLVADAAKAPNRNVNVEISAYASPDGGVTLNDKLAGQRETNTSRYLARELKKSEVNAPVATHYTAQDWEGFKELVDRSDIQDKNLILSVLSMYKDSEQREKEIKNISSVYSVLADEILPQLRRSRLTANIEIIGKSDSEISQLAASDPKSLNLEELLYAATLTDSWVTKETIYKQASEFFPNDHRAYNNLGVADFLKGNLSSAEALFNKSLLLSASPEANFNLGLTSIAKGDLDKAQQFLGKASGVSELGNATGLIDVANGNYSKAVGSFGKTASNNAALAQILNKDY